MIDFRLKWIELHYICLVYLGSNLCVLGILAINSMLFVCAFTDFEKKGKKETCPVLEQFLCHVAKTGQPV